MDAVRLALGTLTIAPTPPPRTVDGKVGSWAMTLAPLVGALLALVSGVLLSLLGWGTGRIGDVTRLLPADLAVTWRTSPVLAAALTIALLAVLTRAMHLDGLADTADGLGSGKPAEDALAIMRRGDVGPFGVVTLVLVLLVQVGALAELIGSGLGPAALVLALVVSRLALPLVCSRGLSAARADGLGHVVAGSVSRGQLGVAVLLALAALVPLAVLGLGLHVLSLAVAVRAGVVVLVGLGAAWLVARRAVRRLGGTTGDVLGACVEVTFTTVLVTLTLVA